MGNELSKDPLVIMYDVLAETVNIGYNFTLGLPFQLIPQWKPFGDYTPGYLDLGGLDQDWKTAMEDTAMIAVSIATENPVMGVFAGSQALGDLMGQPMLSAQGLLNQVVGDTAGQYVALAAQMAGGAEAESETARTSRLIDRTALKASSEVEMQPMDRTNAFKPPPKPTPPPVPEPSIAMPKPPTFEDRVAMAVQRAEPSFKVTAEPEPQINYVSDAQARFQARQAQIDRYHAEYDQWGVDPQRYFQIREEEMQKPASTIQEQNDMLYEDRAYQRLRQEHEQSRAAQIRAREHQFTERTFASQNARQSEAFARDTNGTEALPFPTQPPRFEEAFKDVDIDHVSEPTNDAMVGPQSRGMLDRARDVALFVPKTAWALTQGIYRLFRGSDRVEPMPELEKLPKEAESAMQDAARKLYDDIVFNSDKLAERNTLLQNFAQPFNKLLQYDKDVLKSKYRDLFRTTFEAATHDVTSSLDTKRLSNQFDKFSDFLRERVAQSGAQLSEAEQRILTTFPEQWKTLFERQTRDSLEFYRRANRNYASRYPAQSLGPQLADAFYDTFHSLHGPGAEFAANLTHDFTTQGTALAVIGISTVGKVAQVFGDVVAHATDRMVGAVEHKLDLAKHVSFDGVGEETARGLLKNMIRQAAFRDIEHSLNQWSHAPPIWRRSLYSFLRTSLEKETADYVTKNRAEVTKIQDEIRRLESNAQIEEHAERYASARPNETPAPPSSNVTDPLLEQREAVFTKLSNKNEAPIVSQLAAHAAEDAVPIVSNLAQRYIFNRLPDIGSKLAYLLGGAAITGLGVGIWQLIEQTTSDHHDGDAPPTGGAPTPTPGPTPTPHAQVTMLGNVGAKAMMTETAPRVMKAMSFRVAASLDEAIGKLRGDGRDFSYNREFADRMRKTYMQVGEAIAAKNYSQAQSLLRALQSDPAYERYSRVANYDQVTDHVQQALSNELNFMVRTNSSIDTNRAFLADFARQLLDQDTIPTQPESSDYDTRRLWWNTFRQWYPSHLYVLPRNPPAAQNASAQHAYGGTKVQIPPDPDYSVPDKSIDTTVRTFRRMFHSLRAFGPFMAWYSSNKLEQIPYDPLPAYGQARPASSNENLSHTQLKRRKLIPVTQH